jgi:hypothetical protein
MPADQSGNQPSSKYQSAPKREIVITAQEGARRLVAAEINAPEHLKRSERDLQAALHGGQPYFRGANNRPICISDIVENYRRLRRALGTLTVGGLWPCILTRWKGSLPFSAPLDVPPLLAEMLVTQLRAVSMGDLPFPSALALSVQSTVADKAPSEELLHAMPCFIGATEKLIGLPAENAEAGFIRGAKLDADAREPFSPPAPPEPEHEPPRARVAVDTAKPNLTVIYTNGYFNSSLRQLGLSTPASASIAYGLYRFGIETKGLHFFQDSLVSVPDQLRISLDIEPQD